MDLKQLDRDKFAEAVGSNFVVTATDGGSAEFVLTKVSEIHETPGQKGFSIEFLAPENCGVAQGLYNAEHATLGKMELFLVPVGVKKGRLQLQSIFNQLIDDDDDDDANA